MSSAEMRLSEEQAPDSDKSGRPEEKRIGDGDGKSSSGACRFLNLSDYALLHVFSFLNATDLFQLSRACKRLEELVRERRLWHRVDARDAPITKGKVKFCIENLSARTEVLYFAANNRAEQMSTYSFLTSSSVSRNLRVLAIENQLIRGDLLTLADYPVTLVELSLRKSFVVNFAHFFRHSDHAMKNLKVLILDECGWVETNMMVSFSKYPKLEVLSLYMCKKLSDNDISYLSLAGCFGFKSLRVLDARFTGLGDQILKTFYKHKTLRDLYFQSYVGTYTLEKSQRELELVIGSLPNKHHYLSPFDDIPDTQLEPMRMFFGKHTYKTYRMQTLSDEGVVMYKFVEPDLTQDYKMDSVLYEPPYGQCQCGFYDFERTGEPVRRGDRCNREVKTVKTEIARLEQIIALEKRIKFLSHMYMLKPKLHLDPRQAQVNAEDYEAEASLENKSLKWLNLREPKNEYEIAMLEHTDLYALTPQLSTNNIVINFLRLGNESDVESEDDSSDNEVIFANPALYNEQMQMRQDINSDSDEEMDGQTGDESDNSSEADEDTKGTHQSAEYILGSAEMEEPSVLQAETDDSTSNDVKVTEAKSNDTVAMLDSRCTLPKNESEEIMSFDSFNNVNSADAVYQHQTKKGVEIERGERGDSQRCNGQSSDEKSEKRKTTQKSDGELEVMRVNSNELCPTSKADSSDDLKNEDEFHDCPNGSSIDHIPDNYPSETSVASTKDSSDATINKSKRKSDCININGTSKKMKCLVNSEDAQPGPSGLNSRHSSSSSSSEASCNEPPGPSGDCPIEICENENFDDVELDAQEVWNVQPEPNAVIRVLIGEGEMKTTAVRRLSLRGYGKVTDTSLYYLSKLKLELLDVTQTSVTKRGVCDFMVRNPDCRVIHESACVCRPRLHF